MPRPVLNLARVNLFTGRVLEELVVSRLCLHAHPVPPIEATNSHEPGQHRERIRRLFAADDGHNVREVYEKDNGKCVIIAPDRRCAPEIIMYFPSVRYFKKLRSILAIITRFLLYQYDAS